MKAIGDTISVDLLAALSNAGLRRPKSAASPRTARPPTRSNARAAGNRAAAWSTATPAASPPGRRSGIYNADTIDAPSGELTEWVPILQEAAQTWEAVAERLPILLSKLTNSSPIIGDSGARLPTWATSPPPIAVINTVVMVGRSSSN